MLIAMLAGAVALAAPMVANATTYRLDYHGTATYQGPLLESLDGTGGVGSLGGAEDAVFDLDQSFLIEAPSDAGFGFSIGYGDWYNNSGDSGFGPLENVQALVYGEYRSYLQLSSLWAYANLEVEISAAGQLDYASLSFYDQYDFVYFGSEDSLVVASQYYGSVYSGPGKYTLTEVAPVPLPATAPLLLAGLGALAWYRRRGQPLA